MRNFFVVLFFLFILSGCSLFRKTEKTVTTEKQIIERTIDTTLTIKPDEKIFRIDAIESRIGDDTVVFETLSGIGKFYKTESAAGRSQTSFVFEPKAFDVPIQIHERITTEKKEKTKVSEPTDWFKNFTTTVAILIFFILLWKILTIKSDKE